MFPSSRIKIVILLGHLIKSYIPWATSKIIAMFTATFRLTLRYVKSDVFCHKVLNALLISANCPSVRVLGLLQDNHTVPCNHSGVQIPQNTYCGPFRNTTSTFAVVSERQSDH
jgi:hypothetical protein